MHHHRFLPLVALLACAEPEEDVSSAALGVAEVLADDLPMPASLAIDGDALYWIDRSEGAVLTMPDAGGPITVLATGASTYTPWGIAVDAAHVYWLDAEAGAVRRVPRGGGETVTLATGEGALLAIAVDGGAIYWTASTDAGSRLRRLSRWGGAPRTIASGGAFSAIVVDAWFAYVADAHVLGGANEIVRVAKTGGAAIVLASGEDALGLDGDAHGLYWKRFWTGDVRRGSRWMPGATTIAADGGGWGDLAVGGAHVWWTTGPLLRRVAKAGGEAEIVYEASGWANSVAIDGEAVYLAVDPGEGVGGAIVRVAR